MEITNYVARSKNNISKTINNNVGVFQGSPLSPQLFLIYVDSVMGDYKKIINQEKIEKTIVKTRTQTVENERTEYLNNKN